MRMQRTTCLLLSFVAMVSSHAGFDCYCNINHPEALIFSCPYNQGYPIASLRIPYAMLNILMKPVDLQTPYCIPKLSNVQQQGSWVPVYVKDQPGYLGYLYNDAGFVARKCPGYISFDPKAMVISNQCKHTITNTPGLSVTGQPMTTPVPNKSTPKPWIQVTNQPVPNKTTPKPWIQVTKQPSTTTKSTQWFRVTGQGLPTTTAALQWIPIKPTPMQWFPVKHSTTKCYGPDVERDLKKKQTVFFHLTRACPGSGAGADEVTATVYCGAPLPTQWKPGSQVNGNCMNLKKYTPISIFNNGFSNGDGTAVFIECTPTGNIKVVRQTCKNSALELVEIVSTPDLFEIEW